MKKIAICTLAPLALLATDYAFVDLDHPWEIDKKYPWHFETDGRIVGSADFEHSSGKGSLHYKDAHIFGYYNHFWNPKNAFSLQLGYTYMQLDWEKNPRFDQKNFHLGLASVAVISNQLERWRWVVNLGATVDTTTFDFGKSSVYYGLLWGRYSFLQSVGVHAGIFAFTGVHTTYTLPVIGFDWFIGSRWKLNAVFPIDFSLTYKFDKFWSTEISWATFGGPYHYPWRVNGGENGRHHDRFHDAIVEVYSRGIEWDLNYNYLNNFFAGIGVGCNFGGWLLVRDHNGRHGKYYKYNSAPYAQANLAITF